MCGRYPNILGDACNTSNGIKCSTIVSLDVLMCPLPLNMAKNVDECYEVSYRSSFFFLFSLSYMKNTD